VNMKEEWHVLSNSLKASRIMGVNFSLFVLSLLSFLLSPPPPPPPPPLPSSILCLLFYPFFCSKMFSLGLSDPRKNTWTKRQITRSC
jgi:hypothetical protein